MRLSASRSCLVAGAKPRRVLPKAGAITSRFESLEKLWRRRDELPLAPRDVTQTRVPRPPRAFASESRTYGVLSQRLQRGDGNPADHWLRGLDMLNATRAPRGTGSFFDESASSGAFPQRELPVRLFGHGVCH